MTMKHRERCNRKMMKRAVVLGGICVSIGNAVQAIETNFLRRTRLEGPSEPIGASVDEDASGSSEVIAQMENLWDKAAMAMKIEWNAERQLQLTGSSRDFSMSMPNRPPAEPVPRPTSPPAPSTGPDTQPTSPPDTTPTPPGECLQGRTREEYIFDLLVSVTDAALLNDPSTPQGMAFDYLANDDPSLSDPCASSTIEQRYGLTTLYYALGGEGWQEMQGWLGEDQECLWFGIHCVGGDPNVVTNVTLPNNNLIGFIPDEIKALEMLERLDLFSNAITGTLPTTISEVTRLILLDVEQNLLTGPAFPTQLFELPSLLAYRASDNSLTGTIPSDIGRLSLLQQLWVATNKISGSIPTELGALTDLKFIFLYENSLTGNLPVELGALTKLEELRLYENTISETIPPQLFAAANLATLRLELNFLSGTIPTEIGALTALTDLQMDTNGLSGTIPTEIGNLILLENLIVNNNFLSGQIPNIFQNMQNLDYLDAANNLFTGSIPETIFDVASIRLLYLSNNTLSGSIPPDYSKPSFLRDLFLDGNVLVGSIPEITAGQLESLNEFLVHFNFLTGSMPATICDLRNSGDLEDLFSDCGGQSPEIACDFPGCCNRCFEGGNAVEQRRLIGKVTGRKLPGLR